MGTDNQKTNNIEFLLGLANDRLSLAVEAAGIGFWDWNLKTNDVYYDDQWLNILGYKHGELKPYPNLWDDRIHPDDKDTVLKELNDHLNDITPSYRTEHRVLNKDGSYIWILDSGRVIERDGQNNAIRISGISIDITERMIARKQIQESQENYKSIFEHLNDAFCRFDFSGKFLEVNKNLCDLVGLKEDELIQSNVQLFFNEETFKYLHRRLANIITNKSVNFETEIITPKQKAIPISISARLITTSGRGIIQALIRDITERKAYEKALIEEKQKFEALIEHSPNLITRFSRNLKCVFVSPNVYKIIGIPVSECIGKRLGEYYIPKSQASYLEKKLKWVIRRNKELTQIFSLETPIGTKHFEAILVPEVNQNNVVESVLVTNTDITDKIDHEHDLNSSRQQLEEAEKNIHFGTYEIDLLEGTTKWSNEAYMILGREPGSNPLADDDYYLNYVHQDDYLYTNEQLNRSIRHSSNFNFTHRINTLGETTRYVNSIGRIEVAPETGKAVKIHGTIIDITDKKQIENRLFTERDNLQVIMDNIPDAIYFKDIHGYYIRANMGMARLFGYHSPEELIGKTVYDHLLKEFADEFHKTEQIIFSGEASSLHKENEIPTTQGSIWLSTTIVGIKDMNGNISQVVGISRDITQYKLNEYRLRKAKEKAEQADQLKSAFLANMSHEIRTPINGILGFAHLLEMREFEREQEIQYLRIINNSGKLLLSLINDIIDIAKIEAGQINIEPENVDLLKLMTDLEEFYEGEKNRQNKPQLKIIANTPLNYNCKEIFTDPFRLKQVISNLINNALKFTERGFIEFGYLPDNKHLLFFVKDSGIGMSPYESEIIFERFKQAGNSTQKRKGTGLGLAISKGLVELLQGEIWVKSVPGEGSEFYFTIPWKTSETEPIAPHFLAPSMPVAQRNWIGKTILVVEDEEVNYIYIKELLTNTGVTLLRTETGEEAITICKSSQIIDVILMDMRLPGINGFEATKQIKELRKGTPVIAQTAYAMENEHKKCLDAGCDHYLTKPFDPQLFFNIVHNFLFTAPNEAFTTDLN
ncbi:MAG: PAS domain S-box protein [Bacteroidota bacterium]|nr:PAS domain S-box protein [Bacteroidota bacterium]